jgi:fructose-1,6-bisphosphatase I
MISGTRWCGVRAVAAIHEGIEPMFDNSNAPLFARRGLFR